MTPKERKQLRRLVADYMRSEGCSCCRGEDHAQHGALIAEALGVEKYPDGSGYDFSRYATPRK